MINRTVSSISIQLSEVKFLDFIEDQPLRAFAKDVFINQERKLGIEDDCEPPP